MKAVLRALSVLICGIAALLVMLALLVWYAPDRYIARAAEWLVPTVSGQVLTIERLELVRGKLLTLRLEGATLDARTPAPDGAALASVDSVSVTVDLRALFRGQLRIAQLHARGLEVSLVAPEKPIDIQRVLQQVLDVVESGRLWLSLREGDIDLQETRITRTDPFRETYHVVSLRQVLSTSSDADASQAVAVDGSFDATPLNVTLTVEPVIVAARQVSADNRPFTLVGEIGIAALHMDGQFRRSAASFDTNVNVNLQVPSIAAVARFAGVELDADVLQSAGLTKLVQAGPIRLSARAEAQAVTGERPTLDVPNLALHIDQPELKLRVEGALRDLSAEASADINMVVQTAITPEVPGLRGTVPVDAVVQASLRLEGAAGDYQLVVDDATVDTDVLSLTAHGTVEDVLVTRLAALDVSVQAPDATLASQLLGRGFPPEWWPVSVNASVSGEAGGYALQDVLVQLQGESTAQASGALDSLYPFDGLTLTIDAKLASLDEVSVFTPRPLADIGPFLGRGTLSWVNGKLGLHEATARYDGEYGTAVVAGQIGDLIHFDEARIRADGTLAGFTVLNLLTGTRLPEVDEVQVGTNLITAKAGDLWARDLKASATRAGVRVDAIGEIAGIFRNGTVLDLNLTSRLPTLHALNELVGATLPDLGPVNATAYVGGPAKALDQVTADIAAAENASSLTGQITLDTEVLRDDGRVALDLAMTAQSPVRWLAPLGLVLETDAPATLLSRLVLKDASLSFDNVIVQQAGNSLEGDVRLQNVLDDSLPNRYFARVAMNDLRLVSQDKASDVPLPGEGSHDAVDTEKSVRLIPDIPFQWQFIEQYPLELELTIGRFTYDELAIRDASLFARTGAGVGVLGPFSGTVNGGDTQFELQVDTADAEAGVTLDASIDQLILPGDSRDDDVRPGVIMEESAAGRNGEDQSRLYTRLSLQGKGNSLSPLLASMSGEGGLYVENVRMPRGVLDLFGADLIDQLANAINPWRDRKDVTEFACVAAALRIDDGLLTLPTGFAAESERFSVTGNGQFNTSDESLEVEFVPIPRKGLGLSLGKLAGVSKLSGTLSDPSLSASASGLARFGASLAAAGATGGLTLLAEGLLDRVKARRDLCERAVGH